MGTNTSLFAPHAYSLKGQRTYVQVPHKRASNTTLVANMSLEGMGPYLVVEGATSAPIFKAYVQQVLAPTLRGGQIVVMDNFSGTSARGSGSSSKIEAASYSTYHHIRPISIPSRKPSRSPKGSCEE